MTHRIPPTMDESDHMMPLEVERGGRVPKGYRKGWRPCTCHPDDSPPVPCARRYALTECRAATTQPQEPK